ncbi:MAG: hypothetical protein PWQ97_303 [Tepidanaerobacteraceae bacterium]|nr:hypothetical protein [Tepidanaerobacteraceae bacterium]
MKLTPRKITAIMLALILILCPILTQTSAFGDEAGVCAGSTAEEGETVFEAVYSKNPEPSTEQDVAEQVPLELPEVPPQEMLPEASDASINIRINADKAEYELGDVAEFTVTLTNTGNADIVSLWVYSKDTGIETKISRLDAGKEESIKGKCYIPYGYTKDSFTISASCEGKGANATVSAESSLTLTVNRRVSNPGFIEVKADKVIPVPPDFEKDLKKAASVESTKSLNSSDTTLLRSTSLVKTFAVSPATNYTDTIQVNKQASAAEGCRTYQVSLSITGTPPQKPLDVILVIDRSGSMAYGNPSSIYYAKQAAINFAQQVLQNPNNRVAVVSFAYEGVWSWRYWQLVGNLNTDTSIDRDFSYDFNQVKNAINGLIADGGTNTEAGFIRARKLMESSGRANATKAIILLTDGLPTVSIGRPYGPSEPTAHNAHTIAAYEAGQSCWNVAKVFTVGLLGQVPNQCLTMARETLQWAQNAGYYETFSAADLSGIYSEISEQLGTSATDAVVTDVITDVFDLVPASIAANPSTQVSYDESTHTITWAPGIIGTSATLTYKIKAKKTFQGGDNVPTNVSATLSYTDVNGVSGKSKTFPVPTVYVQPPLSVNAGPDREIVIGDVIGIGDNLQVSWGYPPYNYTWSCNIDSGWSSSEVNPQVSLEDDAVYTVTVTDKYGCTASDKVLVRVIKGRIIIKKIVTNEDSDKEFIIKIDGLNGKKWNIFAIENQSYQIGNLRLGTYKISEVVPMDYELVSITSPVVNITRENLTVTVTVTNKRSNYGWFRDDDEKDNYFTVNIDLVLVLNNSGTAGNSDSYATLFAMPDGALPESRKGPYKITYG